MGYRWHFRGGIYVSKVPRNFVWTVVVVVGWVFGWVFGWGCHASRATQSAQTLRVATAQIPVSQDINTNVKTICRAIEIASQERAEILLTPEGSLSGYTPKFDQAELEEALESVVAKAKAADLALALGTCFTEPSDGKCYNQVRFYDESGKLLGFHAKTLLCGTLTEPSKGEINHYSTRPLCTFQIKGITVGALICNDMWANPQCTPMAVCRHWHCLPLPPHLRGC